MSKYADWPFWPSQSAHLSSALYDHNDEKLSSWAQSKVSTVQAITKGGLVLLFSKAKTALQVFGRSCIEDALTSFQQHAFCSSSQLAFGLLFCELFSQGCFKPRACFVSASCSFPLLHTRMGAPTLALVWQPWIVCVLYKTICFVSVQQHNAHDCCHWLWGEQLCHILIIQCRRDSPCSLSAFALESICGGSAAAACLCAGLWLPLQKQDSGSLWSQHHWAPGTVSCWSCHNFQLNISSSL